MAFIGLSSLVSSGYSHLPPTARIEMDSICTRRKKSGTSSYQVPTLPPAVNGSSRVPMHNSCSKKSISGGGAHAHLHSPEGKGVFFGLDLNFIKGVKAPVGKSAHDGCVQKRQIGTRLPPPPATPRRCGVQHHRQGNFSHKIAPPDTPRTGYQCTSRRRATRSMKTSPTQNRPSSSDFDWSRGSPPPPPLPPDGSFGRMSPSQALKLYENTMTTYERKEIIDYDDIYFIGVQATKIQAPVPDGHNFGYDNENGEYISIIGDHVAFRYEIISEIGKGSFGQVIKVRDHKKNTFCALKLVRNKKRLNQQATSEIRILDHLRCRDPEERSCTVRMLNYFMFRNHTIITFEIHSMNIYELTKLNNYHPFAPELIRRFTAQLLVGLSFLWQERIVHCDLKPENILLQYDNKTSIKIIDFGSSCFESEMVYSYIQSRFYRSPEIIFGLKYGRKIDMWSLGCVICEMQVGYPIFQGENEKDQVQCIMEVLGVPPVKFIEKAVRRDIFFESTGAPIITPNSRNKVRIPGTIELQSVLRTDDAVFVDFIKCFLQWDPNDRMTPHETMRHPWIMKCFKQETVTASENKCIAAENVTKEDQLPIDTQHRNQNGKT